VTDATCFGSTEARREGSGTWKYCCRLHWWMPCSCSPLGPRWPPLVACLRCRRHWVLLGLAMIPLFLAALFHRWLISQLGEGHGTGDEGWGVVLAGLMIACLLASALVLLVGGLIRLRQASGSASPATDAASPPAPTDGPGPGGPG
jgi:hypothetical protein